MRRLSLTLLPLALWACVGFTTSGVPDASSPAGIPAAPTAAVGVVVSPPAPTHNVGASYPAIPIPAAQAEGDILAYHSGAWNGLAPGTSGFVLTSTGTSSLPSWQAAGAGASVTGSGLWHSTSGTLDAAASKGTAAQIVVTNAGATDTPWVTVSGDCTLAASGAVTCTKVNGASYGAGGALTTGNSAYVSGASATTYSALNLAGGSGWVTGVLPTANQANQALVGDVTGNTGADTVVALQGFGVATSTPTSNQVLTWNSGTSKWTATTPASAPSVTGSGLWHSTSGTLDSAASHGTAGQIYVSNAGGTDAAWVTMSGAATLSSSGALTLGSISLSGDVTGTNSATVVSAISGNSPISIAPNNFQWGAGATSPTLLEAQQANGSNPANFTIQPQAPGAGAVTTPTGTPGSLVVALSAPVSTGNEASFQVTRSGASQTVMSVTGGSGNANYVLNLGAQLLAEYNATSGATDLSGSGGSLYFQMSGTRLGLWTGSGLQLFPVSSAANFGGGSGVLGINNATTNSTSTITNGLTLSSDGGKLEVDAPAIQFPKFVGNPKFTQLAQTTDTATNALQISAQAAFASASTNVTGGNVTVTAGAGTTNANGGSASLTAGDSLTTIQVSPNAITGSSGNGSEKIVYNGAGSINSQTAVVEKFSTYGQTNSGGQLLTATSGRTLATGHSVFVHCHGVARTTAAGGSSLSVGDTFSENADFTLKNVSGTIAQVSTQTVVSKILDASFNAASVIGWNNNGTVNCFLAITANSGGGATLDDSIWVTAEYN
jgi:hypothetical protein